MRRCPHGPEEDGLGLVRQLARDVRPFLQPGVRLLLQMFEWQWPAIAEYLVGLGYQPGSTRSTQPFAICSAHFGAR